MSSAPPPPKVHSRFQCPDELRTDITESDSDEGDDNDVFVPPDVLSPNTARHIEALSLLIRSRYAPRSVRRHLPNLTLPVELLAGSDLRWVVTASAVASDDEAAADASQVASPTRQGGQRKVCGSKNVANFTHHDGEPVIVDSPRSLLVLTRAGFSSESLSTAGTDPSTTSRRHKVLAGVAAEYNDLCRKYSSRFIRECLKNGDAEKRLLSQAESQLATDERNTLRKASPETRLPPVTKSATPQPSLSRDRGHSTPGTATRSPTKQTYHGQHFAKSQDLARLKRHREDLAITWGRHQQKLVQDHYVEAHLNEVLRRKKSPRERSPPAERSTVTPQVHQFAASSSSSPRATATIDHALSATARAVASVDQHHDENSRDSGKSSARLDHTSQDQHREELFEGTATGSPWKRHKQPQQPGRAKSHMQMVREAREAKLEEERDRVEKGILQKAERLRQRDERARQRKEALRQMQHSRLMQVREVNERMRRANELKRLSAIRQLEKSQEETRLYQEGLERKRQQEQYQKKMTDTLRHKTAEFLKCGEMRIEKSVAQQEAADSQDAQRKTKADSRATLLKICAEEDKLIKEWQRLDALQRCGGATA